MNKVKILVLTNSTGENRVVIYNGLTLNTYSAVGAIKVATTYKDNCVEIKECIFDENIYNYYYKHRAFNNLFKGIGSKDDFKTIWRTY